MKYILIIALLSFIVVTFKCLVSEYDKCYANMEFSNKAAMGLCKGQYNNINKNSTAIKKLLAKLTLVDDEEVSKIILE